MKKANRNLTIRRKQAKSDDSVNIAVVKDIIRKELAPMREQILILKQNSHCAGVLLRDLCASATLAQSAGGSTKHMLEEYFMHIDALSTNLDNYLDIAEEDLPRMVDLSAFDNAQVARLRDDIIDFRAEEGDGTESDEAEEIENVSSDDEEEGPWGL